MHQLLPHQSNSVPQMLENPHTDVFSLFITITSYRISMAGGRRRPSEFTCRRSHFPQTCGKEHPGPQTKLKGEEGAGEEEREGSWLQTIPVLVDGSSECGIQAVGLPTLILYTESRAGQTPVESWGRDMGEAEQQATPSARADGVTSRPTPCLPISA